MDEKIGLNLPEPDLEISGSDVTVVDPSGSVWVGNGQMAVYIRFDGQGGVIVSAHPDQNEMEDAQFGGVHQDDDRNITVTWQVSEEYLSSDDEAPPESV